MGAFLNNSVLYYSAVVVVTVKYFSETTPSLFVATTLISYAAAAVGANLAYDPLLFAALRFFHDVFVEL